MLETADLILAKANASDWEAMYRNVWSRPESAAYMAWKVITDAYEAKIRIHRTIEFQKSHDTYLVYEKAAGEAVGFAGVEKLAPGVYQETGICLGPDYTGKGFGRQIVQCLLRYCGEALGAGEFVYSAREENEAAKRLADAMGFTMFGSEEKVDPRDGRGYTLLKYHIRLDGKQKVTGLRHKPLFFQGDL